MVIMSMSGGFPNWLHNATIDVDMKSKHTQDMVCMKKDMVDAMYVANLLKRMFSGATVVISCSEGMQG